MRVAEIATLQTLTLELRGPVTTANPEWSVVVRTLKRGLRETTENLTDLLPEGYSVRIKEWDE